MPAIPWAGEPFSDLCLPDHRGRETRLSDLTAATPYDEMMGFADGYPLILAFCRGFICLRDGAQMRKLVTFQEALAVNYCKFACVSVDDPRVCATYRYGLGASFPFLSDAGAQVDFEIDHAPSGAEIAANVEVIAGGVQDWPGSLTAGLVSGLNR